MIPSAGQSRHVTGGQDPAGGSEAADQGQAEHHHAFAKPHRLAGTELGRSWWCHVDLEDRQVIAGGTSNDARATYAAIRQPNNDLVAPVDDVLVGDQVPGLRHKEPGAVGQAARTCRLRLTPSELSRRRRRLVAARAPDGAGPVAATSPRR
jgi:hypothetical protein